MKKKYPFLCFILIVVAASLFAFGGCTQNNDPKPTLPSLKDDELIGNYCGFVDGSGVYTYYNADKLPTDDFRGVFFSIQYDSALDKLVVYRYLYSGKRIDLINNTYQWSIKPDSIDGDVCDDSGLVSPTWTISERVLETETRTRTTYYLSEDSLSPHAPKYFRIFETGDNVYIGDPSNVNFEITSLERTDLSFPDFVASLNA